MSLIRFSLVALAWAAAAGGGDVTAAANLVDNTLIKADGGVKGVQDTGIVVDDSDNISAVSSIEFLNAAALRAGQSVNDTLLLQAFDTNLTGFITFATLQSKAVPTMDLETTVTRGGNTILDLAGGFVPTGTWDFGGATSFEIPNSGTPTVDAAGEISVDTSVTGNTGLIRYHDGSEALFAIAVPVANITTTDGDVLVHDGGANEYKFEQRVVGPGTIVDNALPRFDGTTGNLLQSSGITIDDNDNMTMPGQAAITDNTAATTPAIVIANDFDAASVQVAIFRGAARATETDNDEGYLTFQNETSNNTQAEFARLTWVALDVTNNSKDGELQMDVQIGNTLTQIAKFGDTIDFSGATGSFIPPTGTKKTIVLTAAGGAPLTTAGSSDPTKVAASADIDYFVLDFDTTTEEHAFWNIFMPDSWDAGVINAVFVWTTEAGLATETVDWGIAAGSYGDSDADSLALGTEITTTDTFITQGDIHISAESSDITVARAAAGEMMTVVVARKVAGDDLTGDARLISVKLEYTINNLSD